MASTSSSADVASLLAAASAWAAIDPNPATRQHILDLIASVSADASAAPQLQSLMSPRISFGTAGLRSRMYPGPVNMNDLTVIQCAQGIVKYVQSLPDSSLCGGKFDPALGQKRAVVGYDHRLNSAFNVSSQKFAELTKIVFDDAGIETLLLDGLVPTPLVPFAVQRIPNAVIGIMVTASHNPKDDAGYKVYWGDGCQITEPHDKGIHAQILANITPWKDSSGGGYDTSSVVGNARMTESLKDDYFVQLSRSLSFVAKPASASAEASPPLTPLVVYTPMHGVGLPYATRSWNDAFSLPPFHAVPSQSAPDPNFSTVAFPNPEEKGALAEAIAYAKTLLGGVAKPLSEASTAGAVKPVLILANDPDADRLAVAEGDERSGFTTFTGDEIGLMLGTWMWEKSGKDLVMGGGKCAVVASTVSSKMLKKVGEVEGFEFVETLTGFKWIGAGALKLRESGTHVIFSYEEAIGFCCGDVVCDKDGIGAIGCFGQLASDCYARGIDMRTHLGNLYSKYGQFVSNNGYYFCHDPAIMRKVFTDIRNDGNYPTEVGGYKVAAIRDLGVPSYDSTTPDKMPLLPCSAGSPMLTIAFENGCVAQFRGSGTEPKFKYYIEMAGKVGKSRAEVVEELRVMSEIILEILIAPVENGMIVPGKK